MTFVPLNLNIPDAAPASKPISSLSSSSSSTSYLGRDVAVLNGSNAAPQAFPVPPLSLTTMSSFENEAELVIEEEIFSLELTSNPSNLLSITSAATAAATPIVQPTPAFFDASSSSSAQSSLSSSPPITRLAIKKRRKIDPDKKIEHRRQQLRAAYQRWKEKKNASVQVQATVAPIVPTQPMMTVTATHMTSSEPLFPSISSVSSESLSSSSAPTFKTRKEKNKIAAKRYREKRQVLATATAMARDEEIRELKKRNTELVAHNAELVARVKKLEEEKSAAITRLGRFVLQASENLKRQ